MTACSAASRDASEGLLGTAPVAPTWFVLEQPGPWGRRALTESHLDPGLGEGLEIAAAEHGTRVALARRPGRHPDRLDPDSRRMWVASTRPDARWLLGGWIADLTTLGNLDWAAVAKGDADAVHASVPALEPESDPLLLVCTNGRRDLCCAAEGRSLVTSLRDQIAGRVWETTHLSGHRFAPTAVVLPTGYVYGRLDTDSASAAMSAAARAEVSLDRCRGRSAFSAVGQVADVAVRDLAREVAADSVDALSIRSIGNDSEPQAWSVQVGHVDGRRWVVDVRTVRGDARPESCGAAAVPVVGYAADPPRPVAPESDRLAT